MMNKKFAIFITENFLMFFIYFLVMDSIPDTHFSFPPSMMILIFTAYYNNIDAILIDICVRCFIARFFFASHIRFLYSIFQSIFFSYLFILISLGFIHKKNIYLKYRSFTFFFFFFFLLFSRKNILFL